MSIGNGWHQVPLPEAFWFQEGPGVRKWQFTKTGIKLLNVGNIEKDGSLNLAKTERHLATDEVKQKYSHFLVDAGDLVVASSGISFDSDGLLRTRGGFVEEKHLPLCLNTSTIRFKAIPGLSDLRFLRLWLDSREFRSQITRLVTGTAQQNFGPSHLKATKISLPPLSEQRRIAAILDKADEVRTKRRAIVTQVDFLTASVFLALFGDPIQNPDHWPERPFGQVCETRLGKMLDQKQQTGKHRRQYLRNANVQWFRFDLSDVFEMDFDTDAQNIFRLHEGDLLICEGGEPGRCAIWHGEINECYYQKALHRARPHKELAQPEYLNWLLWFLSKRGRLNDHVTSATIAHLTGEKLNAMMIPIPSITLQQEFSEWVNVLERLKDLHGTSLAEMDALFASLQHRAFRGEL